MARVNKGSHSLTVLPPTR